MMRFFGRRQPEIPSDQPAEGQSSEMSPDAPDYETPPLNLKEGSEMSQDEVERLRVLREMRARGEIEGNPPTEELKIIATGADSKTEASRPGIDRAEQIEEHRRRQQIMKEMQKRLQGRTRPNKSPNKRPGGRE